jgi:hypothetical protein
MRFGVACASWALAVWLAMGALGSDIDRAGQKREERIERQLKGGVILPGPPVPPERTHEDSIEPWELVSV